MHTGRGLGPPGTLRGNYWDIPWMSLLGDPRGGLGGPGWIPVENPQLYFVIQPETMLDRSVLKTIDERNRSKPSRMAGNRVTSIPWFGGVPPRGGPRGIAQIFKLWLGPFFDSRLTAR